MTDPRHNPAYPRPGCTESACGWPDPCDRCYDGACREEEAADSRRQWAQVMARAPLVTDGHHEGDPAPVIGWAL